MFGSHSRNIMAIFWALILVVVDAEPNDDDDGGNGLPEPTGPYVTGVYDFEFTDTIYPVSRPQDADGRRIMVRTWYPACRKIYFDDVNRTCQQQPLSSSFYYMGEPRPYYAEGELEATILPQAQAMSMFIDQTVLLAFFNQTITYSYVNVPLALDLLGQGPLPMIVYSHGGLGTVSTHVALMEEFASQGYVVFSVTHPDGSSGIQYPHGNDNDNKNLTTVVRYDDAFFAQVLASLTPDPNGLSSVDIQVRYDTRRTRLEQRAFLSQYADRWKDDMMALVDYLLWNADGNQEDALLATLVDNEQGPASLIYCGHSFGGAAAGSAAHQDSRAQAAFNLDGTHDSIDLFGQAIRIPYLTLSTQDVSLFGYSNEFFFEPLETMGMDEKVSRISVFDVAHVELTDVAFAPAQARFPVGGGRFADGMVLYQLVLDFVFGFVQEYSNTTSITTALNNNTNDVRRNIHVPFNISSLMEKYHGTVEMVDLNYVREWATMSISSSSPLSSPSMLRGPSSTSQDDLATVEPSGSPSHSSAVMPWSLCTLMIWTSSTILAGVLVGGWM